jgi:hypothetical protein
MYRSSAQETILGEKYFYKTLKNRGNFAQKLSTVQKSATFTTIKSSLRSFLMSGNSSGKR